MINMAMNPTVREKPHQVKRRALLADLQHQMAKGLIVKEGPSGNVPVDPEKILVDHTARPQVQVPHIRVTHLIGH